MKKIKKYKTDHLMEDQYEPGSQGRVLKNLRAIKKKREMDKVEALEYYRVINEVVGLYDKDYSFTADDVCNMHKRWLGKIYGWAGKYRNVNITKDNFTFAMARQIPKLMKTFEKKVLSNYTPCHFESAEEMIHALAIVHTELVLIHPFREGNGRIARLLAILMGLQSDLPSLNFGNVSGSKKYAYFEAVHAGLDRNYGPMEDFFKAVVNRTIRLASKK